MFQDTKEFRHFVQAYKKAGADSFGLFLGAGVNLPPPKFDGKISYDTYSGFELLRAIYHRNINQNNYEYSFTKLLSLYEKDWPGLARKVVGNISERKLAKQLDEFFYHRMPRSDSDNARLGIKMLNQAPTLHAAICFATRIKKRKERSCTFERNPKIHTIITPNYDFFFGAGWTNYEAFPSQWKVQTPFSKNKPSCTQRAINYIHGYIPYRLSARRRLVLTTESYHDAYKTNGFARKTLEDAVEKYRLIFIGTSFSDEPLREILIKSQKNREKQHYYIDLARDSKSLLEFDKMGITLVTIQSYADVADLLEMTYCFGMDAEHWQNFGFSSAHEYWERLKAGKSKKSPA